MSARNSCQSISWWAGRQRGFPYLVFPRKPFSQDTLIQHVNLMVLYSLCVLMRGKVKERDKRETVNQALGPGQWRILKELLTSIDLTEHKRDDVWMRKKEKAGKSKQAPGSLVGEIFQEGMSWWTTLECQCKRDEKRKQNNRNSSCNQRRAGNGLWKIHTW